MLDLVVLLMLCLQPCFVVVIVHLSQYLYSNSSFKLHFLLRAERVICIYQLLIGDKLQDKHSTTIKQPRYKQTPPYSEIQPGRCLVIITTEAGYRYLIALLVH